MFYFNAVFKESQEPLVFYFFKGLKNLKDFWCFVLEWFLKNAKSPCLLFVKEKRNLGAHYCFIFQKAIRVSGASSVLF